MTDGETGGRVVFHLEPEVNQNLARLRDRVINDDVRKAIRLISGDRGGREGFTASEGFATQEEASKAVALILGRVSTFDFVRMSVPGANKRVRDEINTALTEECARLNLPLPEKKVSPRAQKNQGDETQR